MTARRPQAVFDSSGFLPVLSAEQDFVLGIIQQSFNPHVLIVFAPLLVQGNAALMAAGNIHRRTQLFCQAIAAFQCQALKSIRFGK